MKSLHFSIDDHSIEHILITLSNAPLLESISLEGYDSHKNQRILRELISMDYLNEVQLVNCVLGPSSVIFLGTIPNLQSLTLEYSTELNVISIALNTNNAGTHFKKLRHLTINTPSSTNLLLGYMPVLKEFDGNMPMLQKMRLMYIPKLSLVEIGKLEKLEELYINACFQFNLFDFLLKYYPKKILDIPAQWSGKQMLGLKKKGYAKNIKDFKALVHDIAQSNFSFEDKLFFAQTCFLTISNPKNKKVPVFSKTEFLALLAIPNKTIQETLLIQFQQWAPEEFDHFEQENVIISVLGKVSQTKTALRKTIQDLGFGYQANINDKTTHILLGKNISSQFPNLQNKIFFSEEILTQYLHQKETPYLIEMVQESENEEHIENVKSLLFAEDEGSIELAIEMLSTGGIPSIIYTDLLFTCKFGPNKNIQKRAKELLLSNAPQDYHTILKDRNQLRSRRNMQIMRLVDGFKSKAPSVDWEHFMVLMFEKKYVNLRHIFTKISSFEKRKHLLASQINMKKINYGETKIPHRKQLPPELYELTSIEELIISDCKVVEISETIQNFQHLHYLNASQNKITRLPLGFEQLQQLQILDLSFNEFTEFPQQILALKNLRELHFIQGVPIKIPENFHQKLPNCKLITQ